MWQNRIYALIIRRILGPYLSPTSKRNLQETLDISLRQGRVVLQSLELDAKVLTQKLNDKIGTNEKKYEIYIQKVFLQELSISLFLEYDNNNDDDNNVENDYSNAYHDPYDLYSGISGYNSTAGSKLVAKVELNGVNVKVDIQPLNNNTTTNETNNNNSNNGDDQHDIVNNIINDLEKNESISSATATTTSIKDQKDTTSSTKGFLQSYVQAALDSLKLTLDIYDLSIQISSPSTKLASSLSSSSSWIKVHLNSLSYKDSTLPPPPSASTSISTKSRKIEYDNYNNSNHHQSTLMKTKTTTINSKVILGKEICFDTLLIEVGSSMNYCNNNSNNDITHVSSSTNNSILSSLSSSSSSSFSPNTCFEIIKYSGMATIIVTIMANKIRTEPIFIDHFDDDNLNVPSNCNNRESNIKILDNMERHLEIAFDDDLDIDINPMQVKILYDILSNDIVTSDSNGKSSSSLSSSLSPKLNLSSATTNETIKSNNYDEPMEEDDDEDEQDLGLLSNILKQQHMPSSSSLKFNDYYGSKQEKDKNSNHTEITQQHVLINRSEDLASSIDGMFHKNEEGYSNYRNILESSINNEEKDESIQMKSKNKIDKGIMTTVCFYLKEVTINIHIQTMKALELKQQHVSSSDVVSKKEEKQENDCNESVLLTIVDLNIMMSQSSESEQFRFSLDVKNLGIDHMLHNEISSCEENRMVRQGSIITFMDKSMSAESSVLQHVVMVNVISNENKDETKEMDMEVVIAPVTITLHQELLSIINDSYGHIVQRMTSQHNKTYNSCQPKVLKSTKNEEKMQVKVDCKYLGIEIPLLSLDMHNFHVSNNLDKIFRRSGYIVEPHNPYVCPIVHICVNAVVFTMSTKCICSEQQELDVTTKLQNSVVSLISLLSFDDVSYQKFDLLSLDSETQIDPDASIKMRFTKVLLDNKSETFKKKRAKTVFPCIVSLASVKSSQQFDHENADENSEGIGESFSQSLHKGKRTLRGADPQVRMLKDTGSCKSMVDITLPNVAMDLTSNEKDALIDIFSHLKPHERNIDSDDRNDASLAVCVRCNQLSLSMHHDDDEPEDEQNQTVYTQLLVLDGLCFHFLLDGQDLKHVRFLSHDIVLHEVTSILDKVMDDHSLRIDLERSDVIRKRRFHNLSQMQSLVVFFRSKLSHPLSPTTPAINVDMLIRRQLEDDFEDIEKSLYINLYDMTHRPDVDSCWLDRFKTWVERKGVQEAKMQQLKNTTSTVLNLFCTVSDCNIDYSSPMSFNNASRTIIRVGEVRVTSNLIFPPGPVKTYKVTIGDLSLHLLNHRGGYESENAKISCARIVFSPNQINSKSKNVPLPHSLDDALYRMGFTVIGSLDFVEAVLTLSNHSLQYSSSEDSAPEADTLLALSLGNLCIYACKDSFNCFIESINELILKTTMPSHEELERMRANFFEEKASQVEFIETAPNDECSSSSFDRHITKESLSLRDVMSHGLFVDQDVEVFEESVNMIDNRSRSSTLSTLPDLEREKSAIIDSQNNHDLIHDFFEVSNMSHHETNEASRECCDCWTSIEHPWSNDPSIPDGEEQSARWYTWDDIDRKSESVLPQLMLPNGSTVIVEGDPGRRKPRIFNRHVPLKASTDPLCCGDMGASSYAGTNSVQVKFQILITDMSFRCRFFDGFDYPEDLTKKKNTENQNTKDRLLGDLLCDFEEKDASPHPFPVTNNTRKPKIPRQQSRYFQFSFSGLKLRSDSFVKSEDHHLVSCMELNFTDMHLIETVSSDKPVKLLGEWVNEEEYPRDSNDGLFMIKMVSLHPETLFSADGKLMGNEMHVVVAFLPIRFFIHQIALRFIRQFFSQDDEDQNDNVDSDNMDKPPDIFFSSFEVKPFDIKVDYKPLEIDKSALKEGSYIQLLNLLPLEDMILRLNGVELRNLTGWGAIISELACRWLQDVSSTQMHKFLTQTRPLHPISNVTGSMKNFVLLPLNEYKQRGNVQKALRKGTSKLVGVLAYETLSAGAKLTGYAAKKLKSNKAVLSPCEKTSLSSIATFQRRPQSSSTSKAPSLPRNLGDVSDRAIESLSQGLKEANAKIIIMPYREYKKTGTKGAMKTVVKGIPVAVCAPLSGAVEALSHSLYGASNQLRPDLYEEREASKRFHDEDL